MSTSCLRLQKSELRKWVFFNMQLNHVSTGTLIEQRNYFPRPIAIPWRKYTLTILLTFSDSQTSVCLRSAAGQASPLLFLALRSTKKESQKLFSIMSRALHSPSLHLHRRSRPRRKLEWYLVSVRGRCFDSIAKAHDLSQLSWIWCKVWNVPNFAIMTKLGDVG